MCHPELVEGSNVKCYKNNLIRSFDFAEFIPPKGGATLKMTNISIPDTLIIF